MARWQDVCGLSLYGLGYIEDNSMLFSPSHPLTQVTPITKVEVVCAVDLKVMDSNPADDICGGKKPHTCVQVSVRTLQSIVFRSKFGYCANVCFSVAFLLFVFGYRQLSLLRIVFG